VHTAFKPSNFLPSVQECVVHRAPVHEPSPPTVTITEPCTGGTRQLDSEAGRDIGVCSSSVHGIQAVEVFSLAVRAFAGAGPDSVAVTAAPAVHPKCRHLI